MTNQQHAHEDEGHVHGPDCNHHHHEVQTPIVRAGAKIGRNDVCPCGSEKKYKKCCLETQHNQLLKQREIKEITEINSFLVTFKYKYNLYYLMYY